MPNWKEMYKFLETFNPPDRTDLQVVWRLNL